MLPHTTRNRTRLNIISVRSLCEEKRKLKIKHASLTPPPSHLTNQSCAGKRVTSRRNLTTLHDFLTTRTLISILQCRTHKHKHTCVCVCVRVRRIQLYNKVFFCVYSLDTKSQNQTVEETYYYSHSEYKRKEKCRILNMYGTTIIALWHSNKIKIKIHSSVIASYHTLL